MNANSKKITVTLKTGLKTLNNQFLAGEQFKVLGTHGTMVRLSRIGDNAKLITTPENVGLDFANANPARPLTQVRAAAKIYDSQHTDESGISREIVIASCLAGKDSGNVTMHFTPAEEKEYNSGMAKLAELYPG